MDSKRIEQRKKGIGGSDIAAILGLSPWRTPYQVWLEKRGEAEGWEGSPQSDWGTRQEPVIRKWYSDTTGRTVRVPRRLLHHPKHKFMIASLDGYTDDRRVVEIKTSKMIKGWGEPGTSEIPDHYAVQCHHYMIVTGYEVTDVPVSIAGGSPVIYEVPAEKEIAEMIIDACANFWQRVKSGTPPEPISYRDVVHRYGSVQTEGIVVADSTIIEMAYRLRDVQNKIDKLTLEETYLKGELIKAIGDKGDTLVAPDGAVIVTYKLAKGRATLDMKTLKKECPEIWGRYAREGNPQRRFLLKIKGGEENE